MENDELNDMAEASCSDLPDSPQEMAEPDGSEEPESSVDTPQTIPDTPQAPEGVSEDEIAELVAEAEQRGYKRGINEQLSAQLNRPGLYADLARTKDTAAAPQKGCGETIDSGDSMTSRFLADIRPGVWD